MHGSEADYSVKASKAENFVLPSNEDYFVQVTEVNFSQQAFWVDYSMKILVLPFDQAKSHFCLSTSLIFH